jgi:membrane fusion protein
MDTPPVDLYRQQARQHLLASSDGGGPLEVSPPWTWALVWIIAAAVGVALVGAFVGQVEVNSRAVAVLRPGDDVRILTSQVAGTVSAVHARSGKAVRAGEAVLTLDAPALQGQLLEAQRQVDLLTSDFRAVSDLQARLQHEQEDLIRMRIAKLAEQAASFDVSLAASERKARAVEALAGKGIVSKIAVDDANEAVAAARRQRVGAEEQIAAGRQELASMASRRQLDLWQQQQELKSAQSRRDALLLSLKQTVVRAPQGGTVEAVLAEPGDVVHPGQVVGKLVPVGTRLRVVSFLPEADRAFVRVGSPVRLELNQLPYGEYGTLGARVTRIGDDLASPYEVQQALGEERALDGPAYRVELEVTDTAAVDAARIRFRSGMLMQARFTLRRQRLATMVLEPLRRWLR